MRVNKIARALILAIAVLLVGLAAACSNSGSDGSDPGSDPGSVQGQQVRVLMEDISYTDNIKSMLPEFEKQTGVKVTIETAPYSDMSAKILQNFAQKSPYFDAVFTDNVYGSGYFSAGYVQDLKPVAAKDTTFGTLDGFYQPYLKPMTTDKGEVYGLPMYGESTFLMYRKDLFDQYGITPPKTTAELADAAKKVTEESGGKVAGITLRGAPGIQSVYPWAGLLRSFGGDFFDSSGKIAINSPQSVQATQYWADLLRNYGPKGVANFDWEQNRIAFTQGKAAMTIDATANGPFNEDKKASVVAGKIGYTAVPYAPEATTPQSGNTNNSLNVHALYLSKFSEHPAAAYKFMSWATSEAVQQNAVATVESVGVTNEKVLNGEAYAKKYGTFQKAVAAQVASGNVNYLPGGTSSNKVIVETGQALSTVLSGQADAKTALDEAAAKLADVKPS